MDLFQWEEDRVTRLRELLQSVVLSSNEDYWSWLPDSEGVFSVKSSYKFLMEELQPNDEMREEMVVVFGFMGENVPLRLLALQRSSQYLKEGWALGGYGRFQAGKAKTNGHNSGPFPIVSCVRIRYMTLYLPNQNLYITCKVSHVINELQCIEIEVSANN
ncbi:hypothetical protein QL285_050153 [Trifolium repens]|nr:hypothetical protein QL285_050153 [Trifolium repens]